MRLLSSYEGAPSSREDARCPSSSTVPRDATCVASTTAYDDAGALGRGGRRGRVTGEPSRATEYDERGGRAIVVTVVTVGVTTAGGVDHAVEEVESVFAVRGRRSHGEQQRASSLFDVGLGDGRAEELQTDVPRLLQFHVADDFVSDRGADVLDSPHALSFRCVAVLVVVVLQRPLHDAQISAHR